MAKPIKDSLADAKVYNKSVDYLCGELLLKLQLPVYLQGYILQEVLYA